MRSKLRSRSAGVTLVELMVTVAILSVGVLGLFGAFRYIGRSLFVSRARSLATNLAQERIEALKNINYYGLMLSTTTGTDATVSPAVVYDTVNYPPETIAIGGISFTRYTYVNMAELSNGDITAVASNYPDTGLKQITVDVLWTDQGSKKRWQLKNLLENPNVNPLDATVTGTISNAAGGVVASAVVAVEQNKDWSGSADATGVYSFRVYHGTYTIRASSNGFSDSVSASQVVNRGETKTVNLTLTPFATGYISGTVWYNSGLVVSQVVANTFTFCADNLEHNTEYIELFNPTTSAINIGQTGLYPKNVHVNYYGTNAGQNKFDQASEFNFVHIATYVPAGKNYLISSCTSFVAAGAWHIADAYYGTLFSNYILQDRDGGVRLYDFAGTTIIDTVGWADDTFSPPVWEGTALDLGLGALDGIGEGNQIVRASSPSASLATHQTYGPAYDSDVNTQDWLSPLDISGIVVSPRNTSDPARIVITGKPAVGAYISASDPNSGSTQTYTAYITSGALSLPYARFQLAGVSTGTWSVTAAYSGYAAFYDTVTVGQNAYTGIPSSSTVPAWLGAGLYHVQLDSSTTSGFVKGTVTNTSGQAISGIIVQGGGTSKTTSANGQYFMTVSTGTVTLIANPNNANPSYVQDIKSPTVTQGALTTQDFSLALGGRITGYVTTGTTPLSNQVVTATLGGSQAAASTTDASGTFTMRNISTGTYTIAPVLDSGQDSSPNSIDITLTSTGTVFVGTFTVNGAFGDIAGTVSDASGLITTGALVLASTNSIASTPPTIVGSSAPALVPVYMVSSKADGNYSLPVRGGATYYLSVYVPVIAPSGSVSVTTKTYSSILVSPGATTTRNVSIP